MDERAAVVDRPLASDASGALAAEELAADPAPDQRPARRHRRRSLLFAAGAGAVLAALVMPFVRTGGHIGPTQVDVSLRPGLHNGTVLVVPPLGTVVGASHRAPLRVEASIHAIAVPALQRLASQPDVEGQLRSSAEHDVAALVRRAVLRVVLISLAAGVVAGALIGRRWTSALAGGAGAALFAVLALFVVWIGY